MANYASPKPAPRGRTVLWIGALALALAVGLVLGRWVIPANEGAQPTGGGPSTAAAGAGALGAPHGPKTITKGVPSGYSRDKAGAATAATNAIQLQVAVAHGQADPEITRTTWVASNADEKTRDALSKGKNTTGDDQTNKIPATTRVLEFSDDAATVEVWVASVGSTTGIGGGTLTAATWSTATYRLAWEGDWKVTTFKSVSGPQPGQDSTASNKPLLTNGLYTFYIE